VNCEVGQYVQLAFTYWAWANKEMSSAARPKHENFYVVESITPETSSVKIKRVFGKNKYYTYTWYVEEADLSPENLIRMKKNV
jgi:hypothetical protein